MGSPKHLWSGDWERESDRLAPGPTPATSPASGDSAVDPADSARSRRPLLLGTIVALVVLLGAIVAFTVGSSSSSQSVPTPQANAGAPQSGSGGAGSAGSAPGSGALGGSAPGQGSGSAPGQGGGSSPQGTVSAPAAIPTPVHIGPNYAWLGMQISETQAGLTVATVALNSAADVAGVNPGDVIDAVNGTQISSVAGLGHAVAKLALGHSVELTLSRGSTPVQITARLTDRPVRQR